MREAARACLMSIFSDYADTPLLAAAMPHAIAFTLLSLPFADYRAAAVAAMRMPAAALFAA